MASWDELTFDCTFYSGELFCREKIPRTDFSIVLDLDETLVHTIIGTPNSAQRSFVSTNLGIETNPKLFGLRNRTYAFTVIDAVSPKGTGDEFHCWGVFRPHWDEFLSFCFQYFKTVNVWSAGRKPYVEEICSLLERDFPPFNHIFTYDDCMHHQKCTHKDLAAMVAACPAMGPLNKVLVIDDRDHTFALNSANGILIPPYSPCDLISRDPSLISTISSVQKEQCLSQLLADDTRLLQLKKWLLSPQVLSAKEVTQLDKNKIFI